MFSGLRQNSLSTRIFALIFILSLFLITAFTALQLSNRLSSATDLTLQRIAIDAQIVKNTLDRILESVPADKSSAEAPVVLIQGLQRLKEQKRVDRYVLFAGNGQVLASSAGLRNFPVDTTDYLRARELDNTRSISDLSVTDRLANVYLSLGPDDARVYAKLSYGLASLSEALAAVYKPMFWMAIIVIALNVGMAMILARIVIGPIQTLNQATRVIANGNLKLRVNIRTGDELQDLAETFNQMTQSLVKMKERAENANPLTKLPGNIVIHEEVEKRIGSGQPFTVIYADLDNFKAFNDKYGISKGDEAIKLLSGVFQEAIKHQGRPDDFLGHEGGDDFVLVTVPERVPGLTQEICQRFDERVRDLYSADDKSQGFIEAHSRAGDLQRFPIMTVSLMGVTNLVSPFKYFVEIVARAAEIKKKTKKLSQENGRSTYYEDHRKTSASENASTAVPSDH